MLKYETIESIPENAIELEICKKIREAKKEPLNPEDLDIFVRIDLMLEGQIFSAADLVEMPLVNIIKKRLQLYQFTISDDKLILFLAYVAKTPGSAMMYLWYFQYFCQINDITDITWKIFTRRMFPLGMPHEEVLHEIWRNTKVDIANKNMSYNLVDLGSVAGKSLIFKSV